jgi:hypothetical protein
MHWSVPRILRTALIQLNQAAGDARLRTRSAPDQRESWSVYLATLGGMAIGLVALFWLSLGAINRLGLLPPPQLSNNLCIDQKLAYLRENTIEQPTILTVGSSVAWRSIDSAEFRQASDGRSMPLNGAFCGLKMNQTEFTTSYLLGHYPSVRSVVLVLSPLDLTECSTTNARVFDPNDVDNFVFRRDVEFTFYLKYFDPLILAKNVVILRSMRDGKLPLESMTMDRYGDAPLDTDASREGIVYGALEPLDPTCLASLTKLTHDTEAQGRRLIVVTTPMSPVWKASFDPSGAVMHDMTRDIQRAVAGTEAVFWDANRDFPMDPGDFIDAIHLRWSAAKVFSRELVRATGLGLTRATYRTTSGRHAV